MDIKHVVEKTRFKTSINNLQNNIIIDTLLAGNNFIDNKINIKKIKDGHEIEKVRFYDKNVNNKEYVEIQIKLTELEGFYSIGTFPKDILYDDISLHNIIKYLIDERIFRYNEEYKINDKLSISIVESEVNTYVKIILNFTLDNNKEDENIEVNSTDIKCIDNIVVDAISAFFIHIIGMQYADKFAEAIDV